MTGQSTSGVRKGHELDQTKLENYLLENIPGFKSPLSINQFQFGQSNPTFLLRDANQQQYVLRKKPPGALVSNTAHAIEREYQVIKALEKTEVPVPKVYVLCKDTNILGTPFYVMEFLKGRIFEDCRMLSLAFEERQALWHAAIKTLAQLHAVDFKRIGLESYGKQVGFYKRQMKSLARISDAQSKGELVDPIPRLDEIFSWFEKNQVKDEARLIHGDFKIDNLVYHPTEPRVIGILDWELSTIGHPYSDLSNLLQPYYIPSHSPAGLLGFKYATEIPVPPADELIQLYCAYTIRAFPLDRWTFAIAFSFFRLAVILQGIAARVVRKQASSAEAKVYAARFKPVCLLILDIIDQKNVLGYSYSAIVFAGGLVGYLKAGSLPSLLAGSIFGILAAIGAYQVSQDPKNVTLALVVSFILLLVMGKRFYNGRKFMPAGLVSILSILMVLRYATRLL